MILLIDSSPAFNLRRLPPNWRTLPVSAVYSYPTNGDLCIRETVRQPFLPIDILISGKLGLEMELEKVYGVSPPCIIAASKLAVINL